MAERGTSDVMASDKIEGTAVYGPDRDKIGSIECVMIGKRSGKVEYAVLSFGGFLGIGDEHYPLPWSSLTYNTDHGGYQVNVTRAELEGAPKYDHQNDWDWADAAAGSTTITDSRGCTDRPPKTGAGRKSEARPASNIHISALTISLANEWREL